MTQIKLDKGRILIFVLALALAGFSFYFWFPGSLSPDSWDSWEQAQSGDYRDHHPTIMAFTWRILELFLPGPWNMLLFHLLIFWGGLTLLTLNFYEKFRLWSIFLLFVGLTPTVFGNLGVLWKDIGLGSSFVLATGLAMSYQRTLKNKYLVLALVFISYGLLVRHNSLLASIPFLLYLINTWLIVKQKKFRPILALCAIVIAILSIKFGYGVFDTYVLKPEKKVIEQHLMYSDLAALSAETGEDLLPEEFKGKPFTLAEISKVYFDDNRCSDGINYGGYFKIRTEEDLRRKIRDQWFTNIIKHPGAYLSHRLRYFRGLLGIDHSPCRSFHLSFDENQDKPSSTKVYLRQKADSFLAWFENETPLFYPWFFVSACFSMFFLGLLLKKSDEKLAVLMLTASGILYFLPYFFLSVCCDFRYAWWTAICAYVSFLILVFSYSKSLKSYFLFLQKK